MPKHAEPPVQDPCCMDAETSLPGAAAASNLLHIACSAQHVMPWPTNLDPKLRHRCSYMLPQSKSFLRRSVFFLASFFLVSSRRSLPALILQHTQQSTAASASAQRSFLHRYCTTRADACRDRCSARETRHRADCVLPPLQTCCIVS